MQGQKLLQKLYFADELGDAGSSLTSLTIVRLNCRIMRLLLTKKCQWWRKVQWLINLSSLFTGNVKKFYYQCHCLVPLFNVTENPLVTWVCKVSLVICKTLKDVYSPDSSSMFCDQILLAWTHWINPPRNQISKYCLFRSLCLLLIYRRRIFAFSNPQFF